MSFNKKTTGILLFILFAIIMLLNFQASVSGKYRISGFRAYAVNKGYENHGLNEGDMVLVSKKRNATDKIDINIGEIIAYKKEGNKETYFGKVIDIKDELVTLVDGNNINSERIIGKTMKIVPKLGFIFLYMKNNIFISAIVLLFALLIFRNILRNLRHETKATKIDN